MSEGKHSKLLSPSGSGLWMICTAMPQAVVASGIVDEGGPAAARGTLQHAYAELVRKDEVEMVCPDDLDPDEWDQVVVAVDCIDMYLTAEGTYESDPKQFREYLELEVGFDGWRKECFGTVDFVRLDIRLRKLYVFDYKFGRVGVSVEGNSQLMIYALAVIDHMLNKLNVDLRKMVDDIVLGIAQPKVSKQLQTSTITLSSLIEWDKEVLQPAQLKILKNEVAFVTGSHCVEKYCKHRRNCETYNAQGVADMENFVDLYHEGIDTDTSVAKTINALSIEELAELLDRAPLIEGVLADVRARAFELIDSGNAVPGYKIVEGQGKRVWADEDAADTFLTNQKIKVDERYTKKLITLPQAEKLLKEQEKLDNPRTLARFKELTEWKPGKDTLVPESDPRPAIVKQENVDKEVDELFLDGEFDDIDSLLDSFDEPTEGDELDALLADL